MGFSSFDIKFLIICRIVSVDNTVDIPNLLPSNDANVLFPVPDVPANKIMIFLLDSIFSINNKKNKSYTQDLTQYKNPSYIQVSDTYTSLNVY